MTKKLFIYLPIILVVLGALIYGKTLFYDFVPYDDPAFVSENHFVAQGFSVEGVRWAFLYDSQVGELMHQGIENLWHPLTWLSHMLDVEIFGIDNPGGHHATNVFLFLCTIPLVFWSCAKLLGNVWAGFFMALLWLAHPMKVESVAWISERKDLLSGLFFWGAFGCAIQSLKSGVKWKWLGFGLFVLALLSKPSVVILPPLVVLAYGYLNEQKKWDLRFLINGFRQWWTWFAAAGVVAVITVVMQGGGSHEYFIAQSSLKSRVMVAGSGFWFYLYRIVVPFDLNFYYRPVQLSQWIHLLSWVGIFAICALVWLKRSSWGTLFMGIAWLLICWVPVSGILYVGSSFTADRYMYIAFAGLLFPLVKYLSTLSWGRMVIPVLATFWSFVSWKQVDVWKDGWTLFKHSTKVQPEVAIGWNNLGTLQLRSGKIEDALRSYQHASVANPLDYFSQYHLGLINDKTGNIEKAVSHYMKVLEIYPAYTPALIKLGIIKMKQGEIQEARDLFVRGKNNDIRLILLSFECEIILKNLQEALKLMQILESGSLSSKQEDRFQRLKESFFLIREK